MTVQRMRIACQLPKTTNTGRFIMYSGISKIYYRKPVGHVFTKPVQIEGINQNIFSQYVVFPTDGMDVCLLRLLTSKPHE